MTIIIFIIIVIRRSIKMIMTIIILASLTLVLNLIIELYFIVETNGQTNSEKKNPF